jgi:hypothetical protein
MEMKISRSRRESTSLFKLAARIAALETENAGLPDKVAATKALANKATTAHGVEFAKLNDGLATHTDDLEDAVDDMANTNELAQLSLKQSLLASLATGIAGAKSANQAALAKEAKRSVSGFADMNSALDVIEAKDSANTKALAQNEPETIGWNQCNQQGGNGADSQVVVVMECSYVKKRDDTVMHLSINANQRQINGHSRWKIQVNTVNSNGWANCRSKSNHAMGAIYTRFHGSYSTDLHRPMYMGGACQKSENGQIIKAGKMTMRYIQTDVSSDSYWNWESSARMIMVEKSQYH